MKQLLFLMFISVNSFSQYITEQEEIISVLQNQQQSWNSGDIVGFMEGYWKSDSLKFIGQSGLTYGWKNTLENYQKNFPDKAVMGKLQFEIISVEMFGENFAFVVGKWKLEREKPVGGYFSLLWKRIGGKWLIVADHSS